MLQQASAQTSQSCFGVLPKIPLCVFHPFWMVRDLSQNKRSGIQLQMSGLHIKPVNKNGLIDSSVGEYFPNVYRHQFVSNRLNDKGTNLLTLTCLPMGDGTCLRSKKVFLVFSHYHHRQQCLQSLLFSTSMLAYITVDGDWHEVVLITWMAPPIHHVGSSLSTQLPIFFESNILLLNNVTQTEYLQDSNVFISGTSQNKQL